MRHHPTPAPVRYFVAFTVTAFALFVLLFWAFGMRQIADEDNLMENMQAVVILFSIAVFVTQALRVGSTQRLTLWAAAWLSLSFLLRELDIEDTPGMPALLVDLGSGSGRNWMLAGGWLLILVLTLIHVYRARPVLMNLVQTWLRSPAFLLMVSAATLLVLGEFFEKGLSHWWANAFFEELSEFSGDCCMAMAGLLSGERARGSR